MLGRIVDLWRRNAPASKEDAEEQAGVAPYVVEDGIPVFLLITSRRTQRWIFPKGACGPDEAPEVAAMREAMEEAGVEGEVDEDALGVYRDIKRAARNRPIAVRLYPMRVTRQHDDWREKRVRRRHWATLDEARELITTPGLLQLVEQADARIRAQHRSHAGEQRQTQIQHR